jgi:hypothetical protein
VNFEQIEKQLTKTLRIFPRPILRLAGRPAVPWDRALTLYRVNQQERWIELQNPATGHVVQLWGDNIKGFTRPDILELRQQIVITGSGVELEPIPSGGADAATAAAGAVQDLVSRTRRLQQALLSLPEHVRGPSADRQLCQAPLWDSVELEGFRSAANRLDETTAATAAKLVTNLRFLEDRALEVRAVSLSYGYDYNRFPHAMWHFHWAEADQALAKLTGAAAAVSV